jgi:mono/diheme cytochrome c family protein
MKKLLAASGALVLSSLTFGMLASTPLPARAAAPSPRPAASAAPTPPRASAAAAVTPAIRRGRYLVQITGCNDCHTAGYAERGGQVDEADWLTGVPVGFRGPWGVSYPANLRRTVRNLTEEQWMRFARAPRLPPMPWFALRDMDDADLRDLYRYIRSLPERDEPMPAAVAPGAPVATPVIDFVPRGPDAGTAGAAR